MLITKDNIGGVILAGGRSSRMQFENKALLELGGKPLVAHVIARAKPQVAQLSINANRDLERFDEFAIPVVPDNFGPEAGPLAGILTGMQFSRNKLALEDVLSTPLRDGLYSPMALIRSLPNSVLNITDISPGDFANLNTPEDLANARMRLQASKDGR